MYVFGAYLCIYTYVSMYIFGMDMCIYTYSFSDSFLLEVVSDRNPLEGSM